MLKIDLGITLQKGYFVAEKTNTINTENTEKLFHLLNKLEKSNIILSSKAINTLMSLSNKDFNYISKSLKEQFKPLKGQFLRSSFASGSDIMDEQFSYEDFIVQITHYFITYGLGEVDEEIFEKPNGRKIEIENIINKKEIQELNSNFRIIDVKSISEFKNEVSIILNSPVVFGKQQIEFIQEAFDNGLLMDLLND